MAIHTLEFYVVAIHTLTPLYRGLERVDCCRTYQTKNPSVYIAAEQRRAPAARIRRHCPLNQKRRHTRDAVMFPGAPGRIRTVDTRFRRAVLYPLSYGGK